MEGQLSNSLTRYFNLHLVWSGATICGWCVPICRLEWIIRGSKEHWIAKLNWSARIEGDTSQVWLIDKKEHKFLSLILFANEHETKVFICPRLSQRKTWFKINISANLRQVDGKGSYRVCFQLTRHSILCNNKNNWI